MENNYKKFSTDHVVLTKEMLDDRLGTLALAFNKIRSQKDVAKEDIADSPPMFAKGYKVGIIGAMQKVKSTLVLNIAQDLVEGRDILGYYPWDKKWKVLYVNFELPEEELQVRLSLLGSNENLQYITLPLISLANGKRNRVIDTLESSKLAGQPFDCLILDPKQFCFGGLDENQTNDNVQWCDACNKIIEEYDICLIIVHHFGRNESSSGGRGSTAFGAWLTKRLELKSNSKWHNKRILEIRGKVGESIDLDLIYEYPHFRVEEQVLEKMKSKKQEAIEYILANIPEDRSELLKKAHLAHVSSYAFTEALKILEADGKILLEQAEGQGHRKRIVPVEQGND